MSDDLNENESNVPAKEPEKKVFEKLADDYVYDLFKHMTTLSLVSLGGIMTIVSEGIVKIAPVGLAVVVGLIAIGGIGAYSGMMEMSAANVIGEGSPKRLAFYHRVTSIGFGVGIGAFLAIFMLETLL